jgi:ribonuclease P protein component
MRTKQTERARKRERIARLARELIAAIDDRYGLQHIDQIVIDHYYVSALYCDGSSGALQQYETRELPQYRRGER